MPTKSAAKKSVPVKAKVIQPVAKTPVQKKPKPGSGQGDGLRVLKEVLHLAPAQKKPAPDKVEHLVRGYLAKLKEVAVTFENGAAVIKNIAASIRNSPNISDESPLKSGASRSCKTWVKMGISACTSSSFVSWITIFSMK
jgi:hypothetical protein